MDAKGSSIRARVKIACEECQKRKRKCDGQQPTCSLCEKSGRICHYESEESRKRKNIDEDYVQELQDQIRILQAALQEKHGILKHNSPRTDLTVHNSDVQEVRIAANAHVQQVTFPLSAEGTSLATLHQTANPRSQSAMEELSSLMLHLGVEDPGEPSFTIPMGRSSKKNIAAVPVLDPSPILGEQETNNPPILSPEQVEQLINSFMKDYNPYHHFLNAQEAMDIVQQAILHNDGGLDMRFRNTALFTIASTYSGDSQLKYLEPRLYTTAESLALRCIREQPSDLVVQGLALLGWRESLFGTQSIAYNWIAMATGQVLHLGLHATSLKATSTVQEVVSRRVRSFWAYFSVDRLVTSALGMNCTMHWQRVKLPPFISLTLTTPSVDEWAHERFCQLWHLWDSCMDQGYAFGWSQLKDGEKDNLVMHSLEKLTEFRRQDDDCLQIRKNHMPDTAVWYNLSYYAAIILVSRPLINRSNKSDSGLFALKSATTAASSISRTLRELRKERSSASIAPQIVDFVLQAAEIHLLNATCGRGTRLGRQSANGVRSCLETLSEMEKSWIHRAQVSVRQIQELAHRWEVVWALPIQFSQPLNPSASLVLTSQPGDQIYTVINNDFLDELAITNTINEIWFSDMNAMDDAFPDGMRADTDDGFCLDHLFQS